MKLEHIDAILDYIDTVMGIHELEEHQGSVTEGTVPARQELIDALSDDSRRDE